MSKNFKEWLDSQNEGILQNIGKTAALVGSLSMPFQKSPQEIQSTQITQDSQQLITQLKLGIQYVEKAKNYLLQALQIYNFNEVYDSGEEAQKIFNSPEFKTRISKYGIEPIHRNFGYSRSCGQDSCAYFFTKKYVVKILGGKKDYQEFNIAKSVAGRLRIVPIVEAFEMDVEDDVCYLVIMRELQTDFFQLSKSITTAASIIADAMWYLQDLVEKKPNIPVEYIRRKLSFNSITRGEQIDEATKVAIKDLLKVIKLVYDKSGYLFGADFNGGRNVGLSPKGKVMTFDYGRPDIHLAKRKQLDATLHTKDKDNFSNEP